MMLHSLRTFAQACMSHSATALVLHCQSSSTSNPRPLIMQPAPQAVLPACALVLHARAPPHLARRLGCRPCGAPRLAVMPVGCVSGFSVSNGVANPAGCTSRGPRPQGRPACFACAGAAGALPTPCDDVLPGVAHDQLACPPVACVHEYIRVTICQTKSYGFCFGSIAF